MDNMKIRIEFFTYSNSRNHFLKYNPRVFLVFNNIMIVSNVGNNLIHWWLLYLSNNIDKMLANNFNYEDYCDTSTPKNSTNCIYLLCGLK